MIIGPGRSGSTMLVTALGQSPSLYNPREIYDIKTVDLACDLLIEKNLVFKINTAYFYNDIDQFTKLIKRAIDTESKILFSIRHPFDMMMSKIYRADPELASSEANNEIAYSQILWAKNCHDVLPMSKFPFMTIKMENVILNFEETMRKISNFCNCEYSYTMKNFYKHYRNAEKKSRYNKVDKSQVDMWKQMDTIFSRQFRDVLPTKKWILLNPIVSYFNYEVPA